MRISPTHARQFLPQGQLRPADTDTRPDLEAERFARELAKVAPVTAAQTDTGKQREDERGRAKRLAEIYKARLGIHDPAVAPEQMDSSTHIPPQRTTPLINRADVTTRLSRVAAGSSIQIGSAPEGDGIKVRGTDVSGEYRPLPNTAAKITAGADGKWAIEVYTDRASAIFKYVHQQNSTETPLGRTLTHIALPGTKLIVGDVMFELPAIAISAPKPIPTPSAPLQKTPAPETVISRARRLVAKISGLFR